MEPEQSIDRRRSLRIDMEQELIDIYWSDDQGNEQHQQLNCLDFSRGGIRIQSNQALAIHTPVTVVFNQAHPNSQKLQTKVLRCEQDQYGVYQIALIMAD
jgi:c-di-GMP-binding flagellar brake protein YcgR